MSTTSPPPVTVILCSTLHKESDRLQGVEAGANAYLTKPADADKLLESVRTFVEP
jgi:DNA-binding response OmpR family regulator